MLSLKITSALAVLVSSLATLTSAGVPTPRDHNDHTSASTSALSPRAPKPVCCIPGCQACTVYTCKEDPCTISIWFPSCCAEEILGINTKFYDIEHNPLNITLDEFISMRNSA